MTDAKLSTNSGQAATDLGNAGAREAALREVLNVISQSRSDEAPVFDVILKNAARLCHAKSAGLQLVNEAGTHFRITSNWGGDLQSFEPGEEIDLVGPTMQAQAIREGRTVHIEDLKETTLYKEGYPPRVRLVDGEGVRTTMIVPLIRDRVGIGCISLSRPEVSPFDEGDIKLVETFAAQGVIAIENVRQFRELQTRLEHEAATRSILEVISRARDDERPVFDAILKNAARLCETPLAGLNIKDEDGKNLTMVAHWGETLSFLEAGVTKWPLDSQLTPAVAVRENRVVHVRDQLDTDLYRAGDPIRVASVDKEGIRTFLAVPLVKDGQAFGSIGLYRREVRPFEDDQIALVEAFAEQAVIAIEKVRQFRELRTRLEHEAATREILEVISQSRADEMPVLEAIVRNAARLCNATLAGVSLVNDTRTHLHYACIWGEGHGVFKIGHEFDLNGPLQVATTIREARIIHTPDLMDDPLYVAGDPVRRKIVDDVGIRTFLTVPLVKDGVAFGCLNLNRFEVDPFDDADIALVETFAAQAVIAIENVRQFRELQTRLEREAATREILEVISQSRADEMPVLEAIVRNAARLCDAKLAGLWLVNDACTHLRYTCIWGEDRGVFSVGHQLDLNSPLQVAATIRAAQIIHTHDVSDDPLYKAREPDRVKIVEESGVRTFLTVPLVRDGVAFGCLNLNRFEVKPFDDADIALVEAFAKQAVIAIENTRQFKALEDRTAEVEALNTGLEQRVETQVDQLERLGRLRRFLSPQVADAVVSSGAESLLGSHRAMIAILFCDIRGFTAFCESAEPEEAIEVLQTYHQELGKLIHQAGAGFDHRAGDGIMVIFNDPIRCDDPAGDALRTAIAMRDCMNGLCADWRKLGHRLGFGVGISLGYATVGMVGFEGRYDYTASGTAVNLGSRLCDQAEDGEILLSPRAALAVEGIATLEPAGDLTLKGFHAPVVVSRVTGIKEMR